MLLSEMTRLDLFATMLTAYYVGRFSYLGWVSILTWLGEFYVNFPDYRRYGRK